MNSHSLSDGHGERTEHIDDLVARFEGVAERPVEADVVNVVASAFRQHHIARLDEVVDDAVDGAFADADFAGDLGEAYLRVLSEADQDVGVVGQKRPLR